MFKCPGNEISWLWQIGPCEFVIVFVIHFLDGCVSNTGLSLVEKRGCVAAHNWPISCWSSQWILQSQSWCYACWWHACAAACVWFSCMLLSKLMWCWAITCIPDVYSLVDGGALRTFLCDPMNTLQSSGYTLSGIYIDDLSWSPRTKLIYTIPHTNP